MEMQVRNVNEAFAEIFWKFKVLNLEPEQTRNGPALVYPEPVTTIYERPVERVLFHEERDANPVFHLVEAIWMLAGRNDVGLLNHFNSNMVNFSDDKKTLNAAYGYRWRNHFGSDQLLDVIKVLRDDPNSRRAVVQMWDPADLVKSTKDKACNMIALFDIRNGALNLTVYNRSNDLWWGAYGANAVHFSVMQEFVALAVGVPVGWYRQVSNNFHLYTELYSAAKHLNNPPVLNEYDCYSTQHIRHYPLFTDGDYLSFLRDCETFCENPFSLNEYGQPFFKDVLLPMVEAFMARKLKLGDGRIEAASVRAEDWRIALRAWIERRENKNAAKQK